MASLQKIVLVLLAVVVGIIVFRMAPQKKQVEYDVIRLMSERYFGLFRVVHNKRPESAEGVWDEYFESVKKWNAERLVLYYKLKSIDEDLAQELKEIQKAFGDVHAPALMLNLCMRDDCILIEDRAKYRLDLAENELHALWTKIEDYSEKLCED